jgi:hypothetical protein
MGRQTERYRDRQTDIQTDGLLTYVQIEDVEILNFWIMDSGEEIAGNRQGQKDSPGRRQTVERLENK